jgi:Spy/CpxP family protein refolding chaperone
MKAEGKSVLTNAFGVDPNQDPAIVEEFANRYNYENVYAQAYKKHYAALVAAGKSVTNVKTPKAPPPPKPDPEKDAALTKFLTKTNEQINKLQADYQKRSLELIKDYQSKLENRIADFKAAFRDATQISLSDMYNAGANSGQALVDGLKTKLEGIKNFSQDVAKLTAAGFSSDFTQQIVQAGPAMGDEMAQAILNSTPEVQASLQDLFQQTQDASQHGVDFISNSITSEFKSAADELATALTDLATALNDSLKAIGAKVTGTLLTKTSSQLQLSAEDIADTRNLLGSSYATNVSTLGATSVTGANQAARGANDIVSNYYINTTANTQVPPEMITQMIVQGIKFGLPTVVGETL